ncbi:NACHT, LRR and PYD domains-containing protein 1 homolog isoform X2 [Engraulis encrasicolus]|uniref:NACHT, LRR and PYD domains-containing protein 1 homolog isoform X2 n=1 Tax=Engraulis encrasicolus TaxID=184585 RepID=UPI002FD1FA17
MDWYIFTEELARMQCSPAGPLMDIKLMTGKLEEIHLPHFLCLGGSQSALKDAVKVLHQQDGGVCLETCELSRSHARLVNLSLSILGNVVKYVRSFLSSETEENKMEIHTYVDIYRSNIQPLTFRIYLMPENAHLKMQVENQEESKDFKGIRLAMPDPAQCLQLNQFYALQTDCEDSTIFPVKLKLRNYVSTPNFSVVRPKKAVDFWITIHDSTDNQEIWKAEILETDCLTLSRMPSGGPVSTLPCGAEPVDTHTAVDQATGRQDVQTPECSSRGLKDTVDAADFLKRNRRDLIQRVTNVMQLAAGAAVA